MKKFFVISNAILALQGLIGCSSVQEAISPTDSTQGYHKETNKKGETVYRRDRIIAPEIELARVEPIILTETGSKERGPEVTQPPHAAAEADGRGGKSSKGPYFMNGEVSWGSGYSHLGIGLGGELLSILELRSDLSLFSGSDLYAGFDLGARARLPLGVFAPFVGLGGYVGDVKKCESDGFVESCEKKYLSAAFTEAGLYFYNFSIFFRNYNIDDAGKAIPTAQTVGLGFKHQF